MDSAKRNFVLMSLLGTMLTVFGLNELAGIVYHAPPPAIGKQGLAIEVAEATAPAAGGDAPIAAAAEPLPVRLAKADIGKGQATAKACQACHSVEKDGANKVGPALWNVVERPKASHEGFAYSEALLGRKAENWGYDQLDQFLAGPKAYVPGTKMNYAGIKDPQNRADVLAYLQSLADAPKPFPAQ
jgi:cytochrome c